MKQAVVAIVIVTLCFCAIFGKLLLDAREATRTQAVQVAERLVATLSTEIARNIESYNLSLEGLIENLKYPEIAKLSPEVRQALLFDRSATAKHLHAITLLDENGVVRLDSRTPFPQPIDRSDRDYFQVQKGTEPIGLYVSAPFLTPTTHDHVIAISRRLSNPDGSFAGVVVGSVRLAYFQEVFKTGSLGLNGNISLLRNDGTLLTRWPFQQAMLGYDLRRSELFKHFPQAKSGHFETSNLTDGVRRIVVYSQIGDLPLIIGVGQATNDIYVEWNRYAATLVSLLTVLCVVSIGLSLYLIREIRRRNAAEEALALLASKDGLTGLANRRKFDEVVDREWRRVARERSSISLIIFDVDHFKRYNDTYGHQAGDNLLKTIGNVMLQSINRSADLAARYGGDEFAILLPNTSAFDGVRIAENIRGRLAEACVSNYIVAGTLSIGIASVIPSAKVDGPSTLIKLADDASYQAKKNGRNRVEVAPPYSSGRRLVADASQAVAA